MNNAVFHGATKEVVVKAQRRPRSIWVQIINDGNPLDDSAEVKKSRRGIFSILKELEERFRAETKIKKGYDDIGTLVEVSIPVIPLNHEV